MSKQLALVAPVVAILALTACNDAPEGGVVAIDPAEPTTTDDLVLVVTEDAVDPNKKDVVDYTIRWSVNGSPREDLTGDTVPASETAKGQIWVADVTPTDGELDGVTISAEATIGNTPPTATVSIAPTEPGSDEDLVVTAAGEDLDGDAVSLVYTWTVDGSAAAGSYQDRVPGDATRRGEVWEVTVTPDDGDDTGEPVSASVTIANVAPEISGAVTLSPTVVDETVTVTASASARDNDNDDVSLTWVWYVSGGEVKRGADNTLTGADFAKGDELFVEVIPNDGFVDGEAVQSDTVTVVNAAPSITSVTVTPEPPVRTDTTLSCAPEGFSDPDGDSATYSYAWSVNGTDAGVGTAELTGDAFSKGDLVDCTVTPSDGETVGAPVTSDAVSIEDTPPTLTSATISPSTADRTMTLAVTLGSASDADGDSISYEYAWTVNGSAAGTGATLSDAFSKGDSVGVSVTPVAAGVRGTPVAASAITIVNATPNMLTHVIAPSTAYTDTTITSAPTASDADGDRLTFSYRWTVNGTSTSFTSSTLPGSAFGKGDVVLAYARANDGTTNSAELVSNSVTIQNSPPTTPTIAISPSAPKEGDDLVCSITAASTDKDSDRITYDVSWEKDGVAWTGSTSTTTHAGDTIPSSQTSSGDDWECFVTATDGTDDSGEAASGTVGVAGGARVSFRAGYYWVRADYRAPSSDHGSVCSAEGLTATARTVTLTWDATLLSALATDFGDVSVGDTSCCAMSMWCYDAGGTSYPSWAKAGECETHNFGSTYENYGYWGSHDAQRPVFTCTK